MTGDNTFKAPQSQFVTVSERRRWGGRGLIPSCALLLALFCLSSAVGLPATYWRTEIVSFDAVRIGNQPAFAVAEDGSLFAAWDHYAGGTDLRVYVAELRESIWISTLLNGSAHSPTIALDGSGIPHVLFRSLAGTLVHATKQEGVWQHELADATSGGFADAEIDAAGRVHVIHVAGASCIAYLVRIAPGIWIREVATCNTMGVSTDLAIGPDGNPQIVFMEYGETVMHGVRASGAWSFEPVGRGGSAGIAIDAVNVARISFIASSPPSQLMYAERSASGWSVTLVPGSAAAHSTSIALDSTGNPHIAYEQFGLNDPNTGHQRYAARQADGSWTNALVDPEGNAEQSTIRVDKTDTPRILYYYFKDQIAGVLRNDLRYAEPLTAVPSRLVT